MSYKVAFSRNGIVKVFQEYAQTMDDVWDIARNLADSLFRDADYKDVFLESVHNSVITVSGISPEERLESFEIWISDLPEHPYRGEYNNNKWR